ncbi:MAG TPA: Gfo/Idh/MocA family oxidoreductase [Gemmataceae bacterium]|nr:Gfo/Idh/MocA family oxidoreductase [Gemmataceae bacterium]
MTEPFRVAFVGVDHPHGAGWRELLPAFGGQVEVTAIVPGFDGGTASLEERYAQVPRFATMDELMARGRFDGAMVCLSNRETPGVLRALAAAGKHILSEKPCGATAVDFEPAAAAIRSTGVAFQTGYLWRYDTIAERLQAMVADGRFGRLISIEIGQFTSDVARRGPGHYLFDLEQSGRGFFSWLGCHCLDLVPFLTGDTIVAVTARVGRFGATDVAVEDGGTVVLELARGTLVTLTGGYWLPRWTGELNLSFRGSQRWVHWDPTHPGTGGRLRIHGPQPQFHAMEETFSLPPDTAAGYGGTKGVQTVRDWIAMARGEIAACRNTVDSVLATLRLLDLVYQSSAEGRRIECRLSPVADTG